MESTIPFARLLTSHYLSEKRTDTDAHTPATGKNFRFALIETLLFLSAAVLLDRVFGDGTRFITMGLHPFWIIVLVVTLQYGPTEALATAILASLFLLAGNMPEQNLTETMYGYVLRVAFLPFLWMTTALVLGSIRSRQLHEKHHLQEQLKSCEEAEDTIATAYRDLKQRKEQLEMRLAQERCSMLSVYKVVRFLETVGSTDPKAAAAELVRVALNPAKFSLYVLKNDKLCLEFSHGWEESDAFASHYTASSPLMRCVLQKKNPLSLANEEDEACLAADGMLACAIRDANTGKVFGMLKIEAIGFMEMGLRTQEILEIVCEWIGNVYAKSAAENVKKAPALFTPPILPVETPVHQPPRQIFFMRPKSAMMA